MMPRKTHMTDGRKGCTLRPELHGRLKEIATALDRPILQVLDALVHLGLNENPETVYRVIEKESVRRGHDSD